MHCVDSWPVITYNVFVENNGAWHSGAIECLDSFPVVENNLVIANLGFYGAFYFCNGNSSVRGNVIHDNASVGIQSFMGEGDFVNNIIYGNKSGGIKCMSTSSAMRITNNTIFGNSAYGIACYNSSPSITNCIVYGNVPKQLLAMNSTPLVSFCDVEGGCPGTGNIDDDPCFVDAEGNDFHIFHHSPLRDAGDSLAPGLPETDFEYDERTFGAGPDIGADEFHRHLYFTGDPSPGQCVELKFVGDPLTAQVGLVAGFSVYDPPLPSAYGDWYISFPFAVLPPLPSIPSCGVLVHPGTVPPAPPGPYTVYFQAMIGYKLTNLCTFEVE